MKFQKGELRIARVMPNGPFGEGPMSLWYHVDCFVELKKNPRSNLKSLQSSSEIANFDLLDEKDQKLIISKLNITKDAPRPAGSSPSKVSSPQKLIAHDDNLFQNFVILVQKVADESSYNKKSEIIKQFITNGSSRKGFKGDLEVWLTLLMPHIDSRVYNLKDKQIVKLFSRIFGVKHDDLLQDLYSGDVSETIAKFFPRSRNIKPVKESDLTVFDVNNLLDDLSTTGVEDVQENMLESICKRCTPNDLRIIIRLIIRDLKMNCRERHVLDAVHDKAYDAFQKSRDLKIILKQFCGGAGGGGTSKSSGLNVMTAISPMLAEACKDFDRALSKCPKGFYSEIKYDGERVQIHKEGREFKFFSRNLKAVQEHKITQIKAYLPKAFPEANDLILDSEIIMVDKTNGSILPFGTLGKHKKEENKNAVSCLFIFDCLYYNGEDLTSKTLKERKKILESNLQPIKHHIELSEYRLLTKKNELVEMTKEVLRKGLEGLVLKGVDTIYEPGKRRWLKVKKDYLLQGSIADTADLVILGCYYGSGKMGNYFSIFLVGCYDERNKVWKTVTKVHSGLTDAEVERMHRRLKPLVQDWNVNKALPPWVRIDRSLIPNVLAKDPFEMPVLEVIAAEFTDSDVHTANSISMRFPRIVKIRDDKSPKEATSLDELTHLYEESKSGINIDELNKLKSNSQSIQLKDIKNDEAASTSSIVKKSKPMKRKSDSDDEISKDDEGETSTKKKKIGDEIDSKKIIFKDFLLLITSNLTDEDIKSFKKQGGKTTCNSKEANLVLYDDKEFNGSLDNIRENFAPHCRHYQKSWLNECASKNTLVNPVQFHVVLRQA